MCVVGWVWQRQASCSAGWARGTRALATWGIIYGASTILKEGETSSVAVAAALAQQARVRAAVINSSSSAVTPPPPRPTTTTGTPTPCTRVHAAGGRGAKMEGATGSLSSGTLGLSVTSVLAYAGCSWRWWWMRRRCRRQKRGLVVVVVVVHLGPKTKDKSVAGQDQTKTMGQISQRNHSFGEHLLTSNGFA